ncbi:DUF5107 domain-containing protein [Evansella sp. AB-rgal1]|uniref:DUF5107 domain-containing protein n=1 Tax=Evansella sp. AB-rgal1 TaxID=3242696 RepID=UPI00359DA768
MQHVKVWEETVEIPTYGVGKPNKNPMFLEKRVYQGSSGKVYPHPVIDKIEDEKEMKPYKMVYLENEYVHIEIMPELGGRIYRALDKTNNYDFVYYNRVIKPALVGLAGPWISGGIEFNWPQHHRPNTFGPVEYKLEENEDGSKTVWVSEVDRMYGTKGMAGFTLHPEKAYLEIQGQLYNRTAEPQTFLWWANPAVAVNDHTQSVFPPDVHAVFDHGKRDVSKFPIATGTYYKMDYSAGVDISKYSNIPVPTSYMAYHSDYNFVGGYDHSVNAGILHVANHHISPGKKQWTWGNGDFGQAWDRNLTDEDGPYIELMTGVYTDNQPDFSWLQPYEEKTFTQYFMPYKNAGIVKNASIDAAVNLEVDGDKITVSVYATSVFEQATIALTGKNNSYFHQTVDISPNNTFQQTVVLDKNDAEHDLCVEVYSQDGTLLVSYQPAKPEVLQTPDAAKPIGEPEELPNTEALFLAAQHLEQYRHATYEPESYYLEGLKRDPKDIRLNNGYGALLYRRGNIQKSEEYFRTAIKTLTRHNPNPYDSEAYYNLGKSLKYQNHLDEAFEAFYKAVWSAAWQDVGYFSLAQIAAEKKNYNEALQLVEKSLIRNIRNYKARNLKTALLRHLNQHEQAEKLALETLQYDVADFGARTELYFIYKETNQESKGEETLSQLSKLLRNDIHNYLTIAADYAEAGLFQEGIDVLALCEEQGYPMVSYYLGYFLEKTGNSQKALYYYDKASKACPDYCFPNSLLDMLVLQQAINTNERDAKAHYYLGNLLFDKKRYEEAIQHWELSANLNSTFPTVHRNLALAYFNKQKDGEKAQAALEKAFELDSTDCRVLFELDQLYKKRNKEPRERLLILQKYKQLVEERDDLFLEFVTLHNMLQNYEMALDLLLHRKFHPWEGGEGKVTSQYVLAKVELGKKYLGENKYEQAIHELEQALSYPENLGEGKLAGAQDNNIYYYLGCVMEAAGRTEESVSYLRKASIGLEEPTSAMFYNDQPPEMIYYQGLAWRKLGNEEQARSRFHKLVDYGEKHLFDEVKIDYFAVSLPDFLVFDEDLNKQNQVHCRFMMGLGYVGLGETEKGKKQLHDVLRVNQNHQGAKLQLIEIEQNEEVIK